MLSRHLARDPLARVRGKWGSYLRKLTRIVQIALQRELPGTHEPADGYLYSLVTRILREQEEVGSERFVEKK